MKKLYDITLTVSVDHTPGEEKMQVETFVLAYDSKDRHLATAPVKKGCAVLKLPEEVTGETIRIFHASDEFGLKVSASLARLQRYMPEERRYYVTPRAADLRLVLPKFNLTRWMQACCRVRRVSVS